MTTPAAIREGSAVRRNTLIGIGFALIAAVSYGASQVITRYVVSGAGLAVSPLVGSLIALFWGTLGFSLLSIRGLRQPAPNFRRGALYFAAGGVFSAGGVILLFQALSRGTVVVVSPIAATNPLFTLFFAALLLRGVEHITARIVAGAILVVVGVVILSIYR
jgi:drug/metabolite transporter, DME family